MASFYRSIIKVFFFIVVLISNSNVLAYSVSNSNSSGVGSLRQAILDVNADVSGFPQAIIIYVNCTVPFDLPVLTKNVYVNGNPGVEVNGMGMSGPFIKTSDNVKVTIDGNVKITNFNSTTYVVTNTSETGIIGSLKKAIDDAEQTPVIDYIIFNIPGTAPHTIHYPSSVSFYIKNPCSISGGSQPANGYTGTSPAINLEKAVFNFYNGGELSGIQLNSSLVVLNGKSNYIIGKASSTTVFASNASLDLIETKSTTLQFCYFGMNKDDEVFTNNSFTALTIDFTKNTTINECHFAAGYNLRTDTDTNTTISNCTFGYKNNKNELLKASGLDLKSSINATIVNNSLLDIMIAAGNGVIFQGNRLGVDLSGAPLDTCSLHISQISNVTIGGNRSFGQGNIISGDIDVFYQCSLVVITGNTITGGMPRFGKYVGINVWSQCLNIEIGRFLPGYGNTITGTDIAIKNAVNNMGVSMRNNKLFDNKEKGIYNQSSSDFPVNNNIQPPVISAVNGKIIQGTAFPGAYVDLYYRKSGDTVSEGDVFFATVMSDGSGNWSYTHSTLISDKCNMVATVTDTNKNTSEFTNTNHLCTVTSLSSKNVAIMECILFPNPTNTGQLTVKLTKAINGKATVYNSKGEPMGDYHISAEGLTFSTQAYEPGLYLLKISSEEGNYSATFIVH